MGILLVMIKIKTLTAFTVLLLMSICVPRAGQALSAAIVAERVKEKYDTLTDLSASFRQESKVASLGRSREKTGVIRFKRPGLMRWEYRLPEEQLLVSDGTSLWYYRPLQKQVVVQKLDTVFASQTPLLFLFGAGDLGGEFTWIEKNLLPDEGGNYVLELLPRRESAELVSLVLEVRKIDFSVFATVIRDAYGNVTRLEFSGERENSTLDDALFTFEIPDGSEVITP